MIRPYVPAKDWSLVRSAEVEADSCPVAESASPTPVEFRKLDGAEAADYNGDTDVEVSPLFRGILCMLLVKVGFEQFFFRQVKPGILMYATVVEHKGSRAFDTRR